jgi:hypothetical protein
MLLLAMRIGGGGRECVGKRVSDFMDDHLLFEALFRIQRRLILVPDTSCVKKETIPKTVRKLHSRARVLG